MSEAKNITIRLGATNCDISVDNGEPIDLSSAFSFQSKGRGKTAVHGLVRPTDDNNRVSSLLIAAAQDKGLFKREKSE